MALTFDVYREVGALADDWDDLADRLDAAPFLRPGWFAAWYRAFARGRIEILAARRGDRLVAVAPFERGRVCLRSATNWHSPVWAPLAEDAEALSALAEAMVERSDPWLSLGFVDAGSNGLEALRKATCHCRTRLYPLERSPFIRLKGSWDEYERRLTAKRRSNLRRLWRRLEDHGEVELRVYDGNGDLGALLAKGFRVEASGWKGEQGTAIDSEKETRTFYEEVGSWAARRGSLRLAFLKVGGRALAFDFAVEEQGAHSLLKTGYDAAWRSFAPGVLLRQRMIERAFAQGLETYEFLGDSVEWKHEWTDTVRERVALEAFVPTVAGTVGWLAWAYARPAARRLAGVVKRP